MLIDLSDGLKIARVAVRLGGLAALAGIFNPLNFRCCQGQWRVFFRSGVISLPRVGDACDGSPALFVTASVLYSVDADRYKDATWQRRFQITHNSGVTTHP